MTFTEDTDLLRLPLFQSLHGLQCSKSWYLLFLFLPVLLQEAQTCDAKWLQA